MKIAVSNEILEATTRCPFDFKCLLHPESICEIEYALGSEVCFLRTCKARSCGYKHSFGEMWCCACPTRKAIYRQYHV
jgi:hypothetical protein